MNGTYEDRSQLNKKTLAAFQHVHEHYGQDYDWYMRTDDDAYVIMENLRYFLSEQVDNSSNTQAHSTSSWNTSDTSSQSRKITLSTLRHTLRHHGKPQILSLRAGR